MTLRAFLTATSLSLLGTAALAAPALAQAAPEAPVAVASPLFPTMGPDGSATSITGQLALLSAEGEDGMPKRLDLAAQFVGPTGYGGYATIAGTMFEDESHLGSLELGGLWSHHGPTSDITLRAGVILPTSGVDDDGDFENGNGALLHLITSIYTRPSDYLTAMPDTTTLRLAVSPSGHSGNFVARADIGMDVVIDTDGDNPDAPFAHLDVGAGFDNGQAAVMLELSNMMYLDETDDMLHVAALTGAFHAGKVTPYVTISRPFGDVFGEDTDITITNLIFGVRGQM
jgi:hypothetical protein